MELLNTNILRYTVPSCMRPRTQARTVYGSTNNTVTLLFHLLYVASSFSLSSIRSHRAAKIKYYRAPFKIKFYLFFSPLCFLNQPAASHSLLARYMLQCAQPRPTATPCKCMRAEERAGRASHACFAALLRGHNDGAAALCSLDGGFGSRPAPSYPRTRCSFADSCMALISLPQN